MEHSAQMHNVIASLFNDLNTADWEIHHGPDVFYVHGAIMKARSTWFAAKMLDDVTRDRRGKMVIQDEERHVFSGFLSMIYKGRHEPFFMKERRFQSESCLDYEARVLGLGRIYAIAGAEEACLDNIEQIVAEYLPTNYRYDEDDCANFFSIFEDLQSSERQFRLIAALPDLIPRLVELSVRADLQKRPRFLRMALEDRAPSAEACLHLRCPHCASDVWFTNRTEEPSWVWKKSSKLQCPGCDHRWCLYDEVYNASKDYIET